MAIDFEEFNRRNNPNGDTEEDDLEKNDLTKR